MSYIIIITATITIIVICKCIGFYFVFSVVLFQFKNDTTFVHSKLFNLEIRYYFVVTIVIKIIVIRTTLIALHKFFFMYLCIECYLRGNFYVNVDILRNNDIVK